jgi:hypothetical protein
VGLSVMAWPPPSLFEHLVLGGQLGPSRVQNLPEYGDTGAQKRPGNAGKYTRTAYLGKSPGCRFVEFCTMVDLRRRLPRIEVPGFSAQFR